MPFESLAADFYGYENALTPREKQFIAELREYLETEVRPIVAQNWEAAEFPMEVIPRLHQLGAIGLNVPETAAFHNSAVFRGWVALELARVDASIGAYIGVQ